MTMTIPRQAQQHLAKHRVNGGACQLALAVVQEYWRMIQEWGLGAFVDDVLLGYTPGDHASDGVWQLLVVAREDLLVANVGAFLRLVDIEAMLYDKFESIPLKFAIENPSRLNLSTEAVFGRIMPLGTELILASTSSAGRSS